ncbi:hypothetical protein CcI49_06760 [Frankia sp. CcI49]|nr:hypothetical protein CcI49_06760 [Frankia sp. CcI49]
MRLAEPARVDSDAGWPRGGTAIVAPVRAGGAVRVSLDAIPMAGEGSLWFSPAAARALADALVAAAVRAESAE